MSVSKGIIYYTDSRLPDNIAEPVRAQLETIGLPIVSSSLRALDFGKNIVAPGPRGYLSMFQQILACLEASDADVIYFCEHDVLYPKEHFDFIPPTKDRFYYDLNWWKIRADGLAVHWDAVQVSGLVCYRELAIEFYKDRIASFDPKNFDRKFEPTVEAGYETFRASVPHVDIRHETNLTYNKWKLEHFRKKETAVNFESSTVDKIDGWGDLGAILR